MLLTVDPTAGTVHYCIFTAQQVTVLVPIMLFTGTFNSSNFRVGPVLAQLELQAMWNNTVLSSTGVRIALSNNIKWTCDQTSSVSGFYVKGKIKSYTILWGPSKITRCFIGYQPVVILLLLLSLHNLHVSAGTLVNLLHFTVCHSPLKLWRMVLLVTGAFAFHFRGVVSTSSGQLWLVIWLPVWVIT